MAVYSKKQLIEQQEIISVVRSLTGLTVLRLAQTNEILEHTKALLRRIDESIARVFEIYPSEDTSVKKQAEFLRRSKPNLIQKPLMVFVSSNQELYGDLIISIGNLFLEDLRATDSDALVIGKIGRLIVEKANLHNKITYFDLDDDKPDLRRVQEILAIFETYAKVVVYHGKSDSILRQTATKSELAREIPNLRKPQRRYIFEPAPEDVLDFLQIQVSINSFHQKVFEAQVARLNARRWTWTKQQLARQRLLNQLQQESANLRKELMQKQQQVTLSAQRLGTDNVISVI